MKTTSKVLQCGFYWSTLFKDSHVYCVACEHCKKLWSISKKNMMPLNPILVVKLFDVWGIDFKHYTILKILYFNSPMRIDHFHNKRP